MILFSCRRVAEISSKELDTRLRLTELLCGGFHRLMCGPCRRYRAQLLALEAATREAVRTDVDTGDARLPDESKTRIRGHLAAAEVGGEESP